MGATRDYIAKLLFPGAPGQRRRHLRFFVLALVLGVIVALSVGGILFFLNKEGRL